MFSNNTFSFISFTLLFVHLSRIRHDKFDTIDPRCLLKWLSFAPCGGFIRIIEKKNYLVMTNFMLVLLVGKLLHSLFASLFSFILFSKISKIGYRDEFDRSNAKAITWIRFALNLIFFRKLQQL